MTDTFMRRVPEAEMTEALRAAKAGAQALSNKAAFVLDLVQRESWRPFVPTEAA